MGELMRFRIARAPQRTAPSATTPILVKQPIDTPPISHEHGSAPVDENLTPYLNRIAALLGAGRPIPRGARSEKLELRPDELDSFISSNCALGGALLQLDYWLTDCGNRPAPADLVAKIAALRLNQASPDWAPLRQAAATILQYGALAPSSPETLSRVTRLMMIIGLVELWADAKQGPESPDEIYQALRWRTLVLPQNVAQRLRRVAGLRRTRRGSVTGGQVRQPGFADLYVTREEWNRYEAGEIAFIENVLPGELKARQRESLTEIEQTVTTDTSTAKVEENETQNTDRSELHRESAEASSLALAIDGKVEMSASYPSMSIATEIGGSLDYSQDRSSELAITQSRETVSRALTRVEERVRQIRTTRTLTRTTDTEKHELRNDSGEPVVGIYRWVDKIQRVQVTRYPHRFLVEFQVPEPGAWIRWLRAAGKQAKLLTDLPPAFTTQDGRPLTANLITEDNYAELSAKFRAAGVEPPPEAVKVLAMNITRDNQPQAPTDKNRFAGDKTLTVPDGYEALNWRVTAFSWANWRDSGDGDKTVGTLHVAVGAGPHIELTANMGLHESKGLIAVGAINQGVIPIAIQDVKTFGYSFNIEVQCGPTEAWRSKWRTETFETIAAAYYAWKRQYDEEYAACEDARDASPVDVSSPARNQEVVREELKRQVIEMLTGGDFRGRPAIENRNGATGPNVDVAAAVASATEIQFIEQAFEWENLTFVLYPYYWAGRDQWKELEPIQGADESFARFLRAGSARVVVPARPGFEEQVQMYTDMGLIWGGGPVPAPGEVAYLSVTDEIRAQQQRPRDGRDLDVWEVRLPSTLIWLQSEVELPVNPHPTIPAPSGGSD